MGSVSNPAQYYKGSNVNTPYALGAVGMTKSDLFLRDVALSFGAGSQNGVCVIFGEAVKLDDVTVVVTQELSDTDDGEINITIKNVAALQEVEGGDEGEEPVQQDTEVKVTIPMESPVGTVVTKQVIQNVPLGGAIILTPTKVTPGGRITLRLHLSKPPEVEAELGEEQEQLNTLGEEIKAIEEEIAGMRLDEGMLIVREEPTDEDKQELEELREAILAKMVEKAEKESEKRAIEAKLWLEVLAKQVPAPMTFPPFSEAVPDPGMPGIPLHPSKVPAYGQPAEFVPPEEPEVPLTGQPREEFREPPDPREDPAHPEHLAWLSWQVKPPEPEPELGPEPGTQTTTQKESWEL